MCVNNGLVGVFNATEFIYAVSKANKGGLDSLDEFSFSFLHDLSAAIGGKCVHLFLTAKVKYYFILLIPFSFISPNYNFQVLLTCLCISNNDNA